MNLRILYHEHSVYSFEKADIDTLNELFNIYEKEANRALEDNLVFPSYDYVLKCSHVFNVLDARGAISVSQRTNYITKVRNLARIVASKYIEQREGMGFPLVKKESVIHE